VVDESGVAPVDLYTSTAATIVRYVYQARHTRRMLRRTWRKGASRACSSGFLTSERTPHSSFGKGGGKSSFFAVRDSRNTEVGGRSGEALCLTRELLRVDTMIC